MKSKIKFLIPILLSLLFFVIGLNDSKAQVWKNLGKKIEKKIENEASRRAERKIDNAINKGFDKVEGTADDALKGEKDKSDRAAVLKGFSTGDLKLKDRYDFGIGITYEMTTESGKRKKNEGNDMTMWFSDNPYIAMENTQGNESMLTVFDEGQMLIFMENQKLVMGMGSNVLGAVADQVSDHAVDAVPDENDYTLTKLPDETLLGQRCQVYQITTSEGESRVWYTDELGVNMVDAFSSGFSALTKQRSLQKVPQGMSGVMLKIEGKDVKSGDTYVMEAKSIHRSPKSINSSDYQQAGAR